MTPEEKTKKDAVKYIRKHKKKLLEKFANDKDFPSASNPVALFMAGSPGAGKTEYAKEVLRLLKKDNLIHIDPDRIRDEIPQYTGGNAFLFQMPISIGVDELFNHALKSGKNFILDGTFANYKIARRNVQKTIEDRPPAFVLYMYQDPLVAWRFTQLREKGEGRHISKSTFIETFLNAKENVCEIKEEFGEDVWLAIVQHDYTKDEYRLIEDVKADDVDKHINRNYTKDELNKLLK